MRGRKRLIGGAVAAVLLLAVGMVWWRWQDTLYPDQDAVIAPELRSLPAGGTFTLATLQAVCPPEPDWAAVLAAPAGYRGRCVFVLGQLAPDFLSSTDVAHFRLDAVNGGTESVEVGVNMARDDLLKGAGPAWRVAVLGTLQGVRDGLPYVVGSRAWANPPVASDWP